MYNFKIKILDNKNCSEYEELIYLIQKFAINIYLVQKYNLQTKNTKEKTPKGAFLQNVKTSTNGLETQANVQRKTLLGE